MNTIQERQAHLEQFLNECFGKYTDIVKFDIKSDEHTDEYTSFNVEISNTKDSSTDYHCLQIFDDEGIEVLKGEDFHETNEQDFMAFIYLNLFLTEYRSEF